MGSVPVDKAGVGSGVLNSFRQVGGSLGIAVMGAIVASYLPAHVSAHSPAAAQGYVNGLHAGFAVGAALAFVGAIVAVVTVRARPEVVREHIAELAA
jgi:sugar phosphate permease